MRRSTVWTCRWGAAALVSAAAAALLPLLGYGSPVPRWDVLVALTIALVCGLGWAAATRRAPLIGQSLTKPDPDAALPVPGVIPRIPLASQAGVLAGTLAMYALVAAQILAWQPDGRQARTLAAIQVAGARVTTARIAGIRAEEASHVGVLGQKHGVYWYASFTAELADGTKLSVDRGIVADAPYPDDKVSILYTPGHPELGGWVDDSTDITAYGRGWGPPFAFGPTFFSVIAVAVALAAGLTNSSLVGRGPRRLLTEDAAAGRVYAVRVAALAAIRKEHTTVGSRAGTTKVDVHCSLRASTERGSLDLSVPSSDIPALAAEFGAGGGRLLWARRWRMTDEEKRVPGVYLAHDGRIFRFTASRSDVGRLTRGERALTSTDPSVTARNWTGVCRTTAVGRLLIVALYAAAAASAMPALTGTASHATGYLAVPAMALAAVLGPVLARRWASTADHPIWARRTSRDPRVTT